MPAWALVLGRVRRFPPEAVRTASTTEYIVTSSTSALLTLPPSFTISHENTSMSTSGIQNLVVQGSTVNNVSGNQTIINYSECLLDQRFTTSVSWLISSP